MSPPPAFVTPVTGSRHPEVTVFCSSPKWLPWLSSKRGGALRCLKREDSMVLNELLRAPLGGTAG